RRRRSADRSHRLPARPGRTVSPMAPTHTETSIRALNPSDAEAYRALRLEALATAPEAFSSSYEEEQALSLDDFRGRIRTSGPGVIFGAFAGADLVGIAAFMVLDRVKQRHKGALLGLFVQPQWRSRGLGKALVTHVIAHAAKHVRVLRVTAVTVNERARQMYHRLGFVPY